MATDAMILTAAREYHTAVAAVKAAEDRCKTANAEQTEAARKLEESKTRAKELERRLLNLSVQKPAEPVEYVPFKEPPQGGSGTAPPNAGTVPTLQPKKHKVSA